MGSCNHDGGATHRSEVFAGQALHYEGRAQLAYCVRGGHHAWVWVDACRWLLAYCNLVHIRASLGRRWLRRIVSSETDVCGSCELFVSVFV